MNDTACETCKIYKDVIDQQTKLIKAQRETIEAYVEEENARSEQLQSFRDRVSALEERYLPKD